jgi:WD40 repeat protein
MQRILLVLLFSTLAILANQSVLKLDTKGHTALIKDILITKDSKIITASADKSVRIWSMEGIEERKILGRIAPGNEGMIFAIALSPDEKYLAVGGYMEQNKDHTVPKDANYIRIYDYQSGKLIKLLKSHTDILNDLDFSDDGRYLVSASIDKTAKVWDMESFTLIDTITAHSREVYAVRFIKKGKEYQIISIGYDGQILLYSLTQRRVLTSDYKNQELQSLAVSNQFIAVSGLKNREIYIYNHDLSLVKTIYSETMPSSLAFSPNGTQLLAGTWDAPNNTNVYSVREHFRRTHSFFVERNFTQAVNFIGEDKVIVGGWVKDNFKLFIWSLRDKQLLNTIEGVGKYVWGVGVKGDTIGWSNQWSGDPRIGKGSQLSRLLNLNSFRLSTNHHKLNRLNHIPLTFNGYTLAHRGGGNYGYNDATLDIKKDGYSVASITKDLTNGYRHNCYGFYNDRVVSGGMHGRLKVYDLTGREVGDLVGHTGEIWSVALDGDRLVSGSDDQTIRIWNLKELNKKEFVDADFFTPAWLIFINENYPKLDIQKRSNVAKLYQYMLRDYGASQADKLLKANELRNPATLTQAWYDFINRNYPDLNIHQKGGMEQLYKNLLRDYGENEAKKMLKGEYATIYPQLSIFVSHDNEWIVWSKSGYYASSINGDQYIGWHINQGSNKEARFISIDKIKGMKRPDVIAAILKYGSEERALQELLVKKVDIDKISPAYIRVLKQEIVTNAPEVTIKFEIEGDAKRFIITQNGALVDTKPKRIGSTSRYKFSIKPESNQDKILIKVDSKHAVSEAVSVIIKTKTKREFHKPKLHILSVGVSEYATKLWNLKYADDDAKEFVKLFDGKKDLFQEIIPTNLINEEAKRDNIIDELSRLENLEISTKDMVIIFLSGHGVNDQKKKYYFLGYDASLKRLRSKGVEWDDFIETISNIKSKIIMIVDTCHSGNIAGDKDFSKAIDTIKAKHRDIAIITASTGDEVSQENTSWRHGALTKAIIEAIKDKKLKTIEEFGAYIKERVKQLTKGKQNPQIHIPQSIGKLKINL